ncbi:MAG: Flp family type IVb pilin [Bosea sp. (in: a-proteobacteria)]
MKNLMNRFAKDESGATAIEYGLIAALISVVCIAIWTTIGTNLKDRFNEVSTGLVKKT